MTTITQHGYLVLADISGYTSFVATTELEHSHEILTELLELLVEKFKPLMTISKLEGDAVFAYVDQSKVTRGDTLIEFMESVYLAFRDRQITMRRKTTCTCNACINIPSLDLKIIAHHGDYIIQHIADIRELVGSDVNLIHRLLKNHITESTGWRAYMMLTEQCLDHLTLQIENARVQVEEYEHLGQVKTYNIDLHSRYKEITDERSILIDEKDADVITLVDFTTPPHVTWDWVQDPLKRNLWGGHVHWYAGDRPAGRAGKGMSNHCAHGKSISTEVTRDWRPFEYSTIDSFDNEKKTLSQTIRLEPLANGGTRVHDIMQMSLPLPRFLRRIAANFMMVHWFKYNQLLQKAASLAETEYQQAKVNMG